MTAASCPPDTKPLPPHGTVDAAPLRQHLRTLMAAGIGWRRAADLGGVPRSTVSQLLYRGTRTAHATTAARILAVTPPAPARTVVQTVAEPTRTDPSGTRRRVQAMHHNGYGTISIGSALHVPTATVDTWLHNNRGIDVRYAQAVAEFYRAWAGTPAEDNGVSAEAAEQARSLANRRRWASPALWAGRDIDYPDATAARPESRFRCAADIVEDAEWLRAEFGLSWGLVAERLNVRKNTLHQYRVRVRERAAASAAS